MTSDVYERQAREALRELRSIAQPLNGSNDAAALRSYAKAAAARISAMSEPEAEALTNPTHHEHIANFWRERWQQRGIRCAVVKEPGGFVVREDV